MHGTFTSNGDTESVTLEYPMIRANGTWGGGTLTWYMQAGDGTWVAIKGCAFSSDDQKFLDFARPITIKGTLSGATGASIKYEVR